MSDVVPYFPYILQSSQPADASQVNANFANLRQNVNVGSYMTLSSTAISIAIASAAASTAAIGSAITISSADMVASGTTQVTDNINSSTLNQVLVSVQRMYVPCSASLNAGVIQITPHTGYYATALADGMTFTFTMPTAISSTGTLPVSVTTIGGNHSIANANCAIASGTRVDLAYDGGSATFLIVGMSQSLSIGFQTSSATLGTSVTSVQINGSGGITMPTSSGEYIPTFSFRSMTLISLTSAGTYAGAIPAGNCRVTIIGTPSNTSYGLTSSSRATNFTWGANTISSSFWIGGPNMYSFGAQGLNGVNPPVTTFQQIPVWGNLLGKNIGYGGNSSFVSGTVRVSVFSASPGTSYSATVGASDASNNNGPGAIFIEYST